MATTKLKGNEVKLAGNEVNVGDKAPEVTVVNSEGLADKKVGGAQDKVQLLVVASFLGTTWAPKRLTIASLRASLTNTAFSGSRRYISISV